MEEVLQRQFSQLRASLIKLRKNMEEKKTMTKAIEAAAMVKAQALLDRRHKLLLEDDRIVILELELLQAIERENEKDLLWGCGQNMSFTASRQIRGQWKRLYYLQKCYQAWEAVLECLRLEFLGSSSESEGH